MNILGIDCSTTTVGLTLLADGKLIDVGFFKPTGDTLFAKVLDAEVQIRKFWLDHGCLAIDNVTIERPIRFASGGSSANTIFILNWFNGAIWTILWTIFGLVPDEIPPETARKLTIGIGRFPKGTDTKEAVFQWVRNRLWEECRPLVIPLNKRGKPAVERFDMADSYIVALAAYQKSLPVVPKEKTRSTNKRRRRTASDLVDFR